MKALQPCCVRRRLAQGIICASLFFQLSTVTYGAQCKLVRLAEVPVTMDGRRPTIMTRINGLDAPFTLDSGAWWSTLSVAAAAQYNLKLDRNRIPGFQIEGVGGRAEASVATVTDLSIFGAQLHNIDFVVGGSAVGEGTVGLIGQNILRIADTEYDLAQGAIRIMQAKDCKHADLAYWVKPGESYSRMEIAWATPREPHTIGTAYLNGAKIRIIFDTGAGSSIVGLNAAARAGIKPGDPGVQSSDAAGGLGRRYVQTWTANFPSLKIGDEEIHNARLRFGDLGPFDMLLGADFFLSHRVYVAGSQGKLYFTYNGGPVFNPKGAAMAAKNVSSTADPDSQAVAAATPESQASGSASGGDGHGADSDRAATAAGDPADAPGLARRAAAFASRHDYQHALENYNRACELESANPAYYYERALVRYELNDNAGGLKDLQKSLELNPDYVEALVTRAEVRLEEKDAAGAVIDLDNVDRLAAKQASVRLRLASLYSGADQFSAAITQLNLWIAVHADDVQLAEALNDRCWIRGMLGQELDLALNDCNAALRTNRNSAAILDSRGLVYLRRAQFDKAIADFDAALKIRPKLAWSQYCRGIAKLRSGKGKDGEADVAAALTAEPEIAKRAGRYGLGT